MKIIYFHGFYFYLSFYQILSLTRLKIYQCFLQSWHFFELFSFLPAHSFYHYTFSITLLFHTNLSFTCEVCFILPIFSWALSWLFFLSIFPPFFFFFLLFPVIFIYFSIIWTDCWLIAFFILLFAFIIYIFIFE